MQELPAREYLHGVSLELDAFKNGRIQNVVLFLYVSASKFDRSGKLVP